MSAEKACQSSNGSCHGPTALELEGSGWFDQEGGIVVTINPEARVSAVRIGRSLRLTNIETSILVPVLIINKGRVTAPLRAILLRPERDLVDVSMVSQALSGAPNEKRELEIRLAVSGPLDVAIAFEISPEGGDLAGRDRIHVYVRRESPLSEEPDDRKKCAGVI
jgi:hypothetical protein